jgi:hypothetical protein
MIGYYAWVAGTVFCCAVTLGACAPGTSPDASKAASAAPIASIASIASIAAPEDFPRSGMAAQDSQATLAVGACCDLFRRLDSNGVCRLFSNNCQ